MISQREARAVAVAAAERSTRGSVSKALGVLGIVQLDTISALARAHQLTLATRARVTVSEVDRQLWDGARPVAFETWAHAASLVPMADWPAWQFRRRRMPLVWGGEPPDPAFARGILDRVAAEGPVAIQKLRPDGETGGGWNWGPTRHAVEYLLQSGRLVCVRRQGFRRLVDLAERVVPPDLLAVEFTDDECLDRLVARAMPVLGVATLADVADHLRVTQKEVRGSLDRLELERTRVEGWKEPVWLSPDHAVLAARRAPTRARFVGPFDNLVWYRARLRRIFDFDHTLEAYLPAAKREHGYYVCPLLAGTRFVGRADLAASGGVLRVVRLSLTREDGRAVRALSSALSELASLVEATAVWTPDGAPWARLLGVAGAAAGLESRISVPA